MPQPSPVAEGEPARAVTHDAEVIPLSDRVLLERHARGEPEAFTKLVKMHASSIYGYLGRAGVPPAERDDLFQEVFCKVHRAASQALPEGAVRPWLFAIAVNTVRDHFRRAKVRSVVRLDGEAGADVASGTSPESEAQAKQTAIFIANQLEGLPLPQREALLLCAVEGLSVAEAAQALGEPEDTIKTRLRRGRLALAQSMLRRGATADREER